MNKGISRVLLWAALLSPVLTQAGFIAEEGALERVTPVVRQAQETPKEVPKLAAPKQEEVKPEQKPAQAAPEAAVKKAETPSPAQVWVARSGTTLRKIIEEWGRVADWTVVWEPSDLDYPNPATRTFEGSFEAAVKELFAPYKNAKRPLLVDGWRGNTVIVISEKR